VKTTSNNNLNIITRIDILMHINMSNYQAYQAFVFASSFACMAARHSAISGFYMVTSPQAKPFVQKDLGFQTFELGLIDTSYLFSYAIGNVFSGNLGDKYSLKKLVCYGLYLTSLTYLLVQYI
jgi:sugar phosphate permease